MTTSTSPITVYGLFPFDRGAKPRWLLEEMGLPHENRFMDREKAEHEGEAYLRINPLGRVPGMEIGGRPMFESGAMVAYLADLHLDKKMAPALNAPERLEYQQWMYFAASTVDAYQTRIMIIEELEGEKLDAKLKPLLTEVDEAFTHLDQVLSKHDFILATGFSAADICIAYHLYLLALWPEFTSIIDSKRNLKAYLGRLQERPSAIKANVFSYEE
jgi:glutathione S-transferase